MTLRFCNAQRFDITEQAFSAIQIPQVVPVNYDKSHGQEYRGSTPPLQLADDQVRRLKEFVLNKFGLAFTDGQHSHLLRGVAEVMAWSHCPTIDDFYSQMAASAPRNSAWDMLVSCLTVGETYFFRHSCHFEALSKHILPDLIARRQFSRSLRIWSAGCATGEEPYSLAILLRELIPDIEDWRILILATDINRTALAAAQKGEYGSWSFRGVDRKIQDTYFQPAPNRMYRLADSIKRMVTFDYVNLAQDPYPSLYSHTYAMDLIVCRNVTIYFPADVTRRVVHNFERCLEPGGWFIPGPAEPNTADYKDFEGVKFPGAFIYRKIDAVSPASSFCLAAGQHNTCPMAVQERWTAPQPAV
jgi:chemotaxis protein methyltransferase CheR